MAGLRVYRATGNPTDRSDGWRGHTVTPSRSHTVMSPLWPASLRSLVPLRSLLEGLPSPGARCHPPGGHGGSTGLRGPSGQYSQSRQSGQRQGFAAVSRPTEPMFDNSEFTISISQEPDNIWDSNTILVGYLPALDGEQCTLHSSTVSLDRGTYHPPNRFDLTRTYELARPLLRSACHNIPLGRF